MMLTNLNRPTGLCTARREGDTFYRGIVHRNCVTPENTVYDAFGPNFTVEDLPRDGSALTCDICGEGKSTADYR